MDSKRFDNWTRNRALRLSRRDAIRLMGASGAAAAIPELDSNAATAQASCSLTIRAETAGGPSTPASFAGALQFTLDDSGNFSNASFAPATGVAQSASGHATGRAIDVLISLPDNQTLALSGTSAQPIENCSGDIAGILTGPQPGDVGAWQATAVGSAAAPPSTSNQTSSTGESGSAASCPEGQTLCGGACIDTQSDPQNCGDCGVACVSGKCDGGVCDEGQTCVPDGEACRVPADCCSLLCPHETQAPGVCGCSQVGGVCAGGGDCCQQGGDSQIECIGGENSDRCIVLKGACTSHSDCLSQNCVNGTCSSSSCRADGEPCQSTSDCCNPGCFGGVCGCAKLGQSCSEEFGNEFFCCEGTPVVCFAGACCILNGSGCSADADCCDYIQGNGACSNGICTRTT